MALTTTVTGVTDNSIQCIQVLHSNYAGQAAKLMEQYGPTVAENALKMVSST